MEKIKRLELVKLTKLEREEVKGGNWNPYGCSATSSSYANYHCSTASVNLASITDPIITKPGSQLCNDAICMPGDNASSGSWFGTKLANESINV